MRYLALVYATGSEDPLEIGPAVPVLVPLAEYAADRERNRVRPILEFLPDWLEEVGIGGGRAVRSHLDDVLLLLDGLDEVREPAARKAVLSEAAALAASGKAKRVVVSGRDFLVDEITPQVEKDLELKWMRAPREEEERSFLMTFSRLRGREEAAGARLARRIREDRDLSALAHTPLMLAFMAVLDEIEGGLPDRRIEIYYRLGEIVIDQWTRRRTLARPGIRRTSPGDVRRVLGPLAWWVVGLGGRAVSEDELLPELTRLEARYSDPDDAAARASSLFDVLKRDTALLVPSPSARRWQFIHSSFAEYFAALNADRDAECWKSLLDDPFRAEWREVVLFAAGYLGVVAGKTERLVELADAIASRSTRHGRYHARHPSLVIALLQEDPGLPARQQRTLIERLAKWLFTNAFPAQAARQIQHEAVRFLLGAAASGKKPAIASELEEWFLPTPTRVMWGRVAASGYWKDVPATVLSGHFADRIRRRPAERSQEVQRARDYLAGPLLPKLPEILRTYDIDPGPALDAMGRAADWRIRFTRMALLLEETDRAERRQLLATAPEEPFTALLRALYAGGME
ncbi:MAG: hypothetical protein FJ087_09370 [Deltaproteobacteria bacterium]|nr:hypothetical protein [Deltaproteobacteria bacterium]